MADFRNGDDPWGSSLGSSGPGDSRKVSVPSEASPPAPSASPAPGSIATALDGVRWDYDASQDGESPLTPSSRYFRDFPWDG
ncbi:MAG: hypothetical protein AAGF23_17810 [Acidobacteriota bacterium]